MPRPKLDFPLGQDGTDFLLRTRREFRVATGITLHRCKRKAWRHAAEQHGFAVRENPGPTDAPLRYPCERLADNMLLRRIEVALGLHRLHEPAPPEGGQRPAAGWR